MTVCPRAPDAHWGIYVIGTKVEGQVPQLLTMQRGSRNSQLTSKSHNRMHNPTYVSPEEYMWPTQRHDHKQQNCTSVTMDPPLSDTQKD